jgi:hypothetical protein
MSELVLAPFDTDQVQRILEKCKDAICLNLTSNLASNQEEIMAIATEYLARLTTETTYQDIIDHVELVIPNLTEEQKSMLSQGIQALLQNLLQ